MSFWNINGQNALQTMQNNGSFEQTTEMKPIPDNTKVIAVVEEAKYDTAKVFGTEIEHEILSLRWKVIEGEYKNRVIFQKLHCLPGSDQDKREKAIAMLLAIDFNAGGKIAALQRDPTEIDFATAFNMRPMILRLRVWETEDKSKSGNWIDGVFNRSATQATPAQQQAPQQQVQQQQQAQPTPQYNEPNIDFDSDDIGF